MKKIITTLALATATFFTGHAQNTVCLGNSITVCAGDPVTIDVCGAGVGSGVVSLNNPNSYNLGDDDFTPLINLGFNFTFYGNTYNQITVGDNGVVSFNAANANGYCSWVVDALPSNTASVENSILVPWQDLFGPAGGTIYYETIGTAPNRIGVIYYDGLSMFSTACQTPNQCYTGGILLYEGSNRIETHISNKTTCASWGSGTATHGVNNIDGSVGQAVPGRNNTVWTAQNDAWEFVPTSPTNYNINQIPYQIVTTSNNNGIVWEDTQGNSYPYNGGTLNTNATADTVGYFLSSSTCGVGVGAVSDTAWVNGLSISVAANGVDDECTQGIGEASAIANGGDGPYTYQWDDPGNQTGSIATGLFAGTYTVTATDDNGCQASTTVTIGDNPISLSTTNTLVSCPGGSDGTATVTITPTPASATYDWYDAGNQTTQTATGLSAGTYNVAVETAVGCQDTATVTIDEVPPISINVVNTSDVTCNSASDGTATIQVSDGTSPYTYDWTGSTSTSASATDLSAGTTTVTVTDDNGCTETVDITIDEPDALQITAMMKDTIICEGDDVTLEVQGSGGSSAYDFTWTNNGTNVGSGNSIVTTPTSDNAEYCVTFSEQCGSPETDSCVTVRFPDPVNPSINPSTTGGCFPVEVTFDNTTNTNESIDYTVFDFNDGTVDTVGGLDAVVHEFGKGMHDVTMQLTSDRGCTYKTTFTDLVEGFDYPKAEFYVNPNPATVFEPTVDAFSQSGNDIISYQWIADGAEPSMSTAKDPTFTYPEEVENHDLFLVVENSNGCKDTLKRVVRVQNDVILYAPNTFTPDGDAFNETWRVHIEGIDVYDFELEIYNRWGELIFESHDPDGAWDGTYGGNLVKDGTYIWKIRAVDQENDNKYEFKGFVNVLR